MPRTAPTTLDVSPLDAIALCVIEHGDPELVKTNQLAQYALQSLPGRQKYPHGMKARQSDAPNVFVARNCDRRALILPASWLKVVASPDSVSNPFFNELRARLPSRTRVEPFGAVSLKDQKKVISLDRGVSLELKQVVHPALRIGDQIVVALSTPKGDLDEDAVAALVDHTYQLLSC